MHTSKTQNNQWSIGALALALAAVCFTNGCVSPPKGYVAKEWSAKMRELGINPIFPPREDVQVGDIYITKDDNQDDFFEPGYVPIGIFAARISDTSQDVTAFYSARASFPVTPEMTVGYMTNYTNNPFGLVEQARDTNRNIFVGGDTNRLRLVGFPSFMSVTFNRGDLSAVFPVEGVNVALAGNFQKSDSVTVSVPVAESYALPAADALAKLRNLDGSFKGVGNLSANSAAFLGGNTNGKAYLHVITEVFYTRAVDVSVHKSLTRGFGAAARPVGLTNTSGMTTNIPAGNTPEQRANAAYSALDGRLAETVPGGSIKLVGSGDWGVTMRRTYERPMAIGYRGFLLELSDGKLTGRIRDTVRPLHGRK